MYTLLKRSDRAVRAMVVRLDGALTVFSNFLNFSLAVFVCIA